MTEATPEHFGRAIRTSRILAGFRTVSEAAVRIGRGRNWVSRLEASPDRPPPDAIARLCAAYQMTEAELLGLTPPPRDLSPAALQGKVLFDAETANRIMAAKKIEDVDDLWPEALFDAKGNRVLELVLSLAFTPGAKIIPYREARAIELRVWRRLDELLNSE